MRGEDSEMVQYTNRRHWKIIWKPRHYLLSKHIHNAPVILLPDSLCLNKKHKIKSNAI